MSCNTEEMQYCSSVLQQYCINTARQDASLAILHQHCIHTVCQGHDYVRIVNVDAVLRQSNHIAWDIPNTFQFNKYQVFLEKNSRFFDLRKHFPNSTLNLASLNWLMNFNGIMNNQWPVSLSNLMTSQLNHFYMKK